MPSELPLLRVLLLLSLALAPLGTHGLLLARRSRVGLFAYVFALSCAGVGLFGLAPLACIVWLLFTGVSFALFLRERAGAWRSPRTWAACVPFLFSNIAAVWVVSGANDLHLLGYDRPFSYYAALHGTVLGWTFVGALAVLAQREDATLYLVSVFVCLVSFLLIALGIDQLHLLKPIGVVGLSIALPTCQLGFLRSVWKRNRPSFALGLASLSGLVFTMLLAWRNELGMRELVSVGALRGMVSVHGVTNALLVAPSFLLAVALEVRRSR